MLSGEVTYRVWSEHAEDPAVRMRQAITSLSRSATPANQDLVSLRVAGVDLAALLVRLAANATASGRAGAASEPRSTRLHRTLCAITTELISHTPQLKPSTEHGGDIVAHNLAAGLRVLLSQQQTLNARSAVSPDQPTSPTDPDRLRAAWLQVARHEHAVLAALDARADTPIPEQRFECLLATIIEDAANLICAARLGGRPNAFRHDHAWHQQAVALTHALEAYVTGLHGHSTRLAQAHRITHTRLVRATAAITLIELSATDPSPPTQAQNATGQVARAPGSRSAH